MFSTKAAQSLKNLFASYHEPAPLSKQQSQKLLDSLKLSFRKQLDREHGESSNRPAVPNTPSTSADTSLHTSATNRHLKDILSNPLFSYNKDLSSPFSSSLPSSKRDPLEVFKHGVARGMMTHKAAIGCMIAKSKELRALSPNGNTLLSSETSLHVVRWLQSSDLHKDLKFLAHQVLVQTLVPFMIADGMEEVAWGWLSQLLGEESKDLPNHKRSGRASNLLAAMVRTRCQAQYGGLDAGISTMLQAQHMFQNSPLLSELLVTSWRSVSWFSTVEAYRRNAASEELFDAHMATADQLHRPLLVERAHLHLHHPTHPSHVPALEVFRDTDSLRKVVDDVGPKKNGQFTVGSWLVCLANDTTNHLIQSGRTQEAEGVAELIRSEVTNFFPKVELA